MQKKVLFLFASLVLAILFKYAFSYMTNNASTSKLYLTDKYYNKGKFIESDAEKINSLEKETYVLYTYNSFCTFAVPCENIFKSYMEKYEIDFLKININEYKNTYLFKKVRYAPSVIIIKNKKIIAYLDANSDNDTIKYQNTKEFERWINSYINTQK